MSHRSYLLGKLKLAGFLLTVSLLLFFALSFDRQSLPDRGRIQEIAEENLFEGCLIFITVFVALKLLFMPATPVTIVGGYIFGPYIGFSLSMTVLMLSSIIGFGISRTFGRKPVGAFVEDNFPRLKRYNKMLEKYGYLSVFVLRIVPSAPLTAVNLFIGLTRIRTKDFLIGSLLAFLPTTIVLSLIGNYLTDWSNPLLYVLIVLYLMMIAAPIIYRKRKDLSS
jgi:uncharacterized membrane protein YdjX (TVP38/TMEM64 family)